MGGKRGVSERLLGQGVLQMIRADAVWRCRAGCRQGKWSDRIHEYYSVLCISEIHSESVTRFISCIISRNSSLTHFRIDPPKKGVRNESSWKRGPSRPSAGLCFFPAHWWCQQSSFVPPRVGGWGQTMNTVPPYSTSKRPRNS